MSAKTTFPGSAPWDVISTSRLFPQSFETSKQIAWIDLPDKAVSRACGRLLIDLQLEGIQFASWG
jgi:hypothetical protein